ncbi:MAG TPA: UDP-N-acetylglucosamine 1-carboxyvinyltransferase, partial [Candidatus Eisenbacteria bacterium]|nr:UDP-N-acetylglucosamine 1-carboxyvinyltransferase [Candidatus Eisenbacteria bacterium]
MEKLLITGGKKLTGTVRVSGSKNVALKALVAACLTEEEVIIHNVPHISDFFIMAEILEELGGSVKVNDHTATIHVKKFTNHAIPLEKGAQVRVSSLFLAPLLLRVGEAIIPNPGGCRLGARPIDRLVDGIKSLGAQITYHSEDGYFHAKTNGLSGSIFTFAKNTHTGTEVMLLAAVLAKGTTILKNAAQEPEVDDLIDLLVSMGAQVERTQPREITIVGVKKLHGTIFTISPDRNEVVTFAIAALATKGDIHIDGVKVDHINEFLQALDSIGGGHEIQENGMRFYYKGQLQATDVVTKQYPGFMTDWQAPWAVLMTQAQGISTIHETVFENKMGYVDDLNKMGAHIKPFHPKIENPEAFYNFNLEDDKPEYVHAIQIKGPKQLHNAVVTTIDLRAGAAVVLAGLI